MSSYTVIVRQGGPRLLTDHVGPMSYTDALNLVHSYEGQEHTLCEVRRLTTPEAWAKDRKSIRLRLEASVEA
jgi:hypothetical protein